MKRKQAYAVFTVTDSGMDYMVKGNFGTNEDAANKWLSKNVDNYPNGLFVKLITY